MSSPVQCPAFLERGGAVYHCFNKLPHTRHQGWGARSITYAGSSAPFLIWTDDMPGANGQFRHPDDNSGRTPYDGLEQNL